MVPRRVLRTRWTPPWDRPAAGDVAHALTASASLAMVPRRSVNAPPIDPLECTRDMTGGCSSHVSAAPTKNQRFGDLERNKSLAMWVICISSVPP